MKAEGRLRQFLEAIEPGETRSSLAARERLCHDPGMGNETVRVARNTFFASVGFGVLAFQKVQVRRRELEKTLGPQVEAWQRQIRSVIGHTPDDSSD